MDELKEMIKQAYQDLQRLEIAPTKNNLSILSNVLNTLETCFAVMSKAKVIDNEKKEETTDGNNDNEPGSDETSTR